MIQIRAKEMFEEAQNRSNRIDFNKIALAEKIIETVVKKKFDTTGATCFDIGYKNKNSVTPYEICYYSTGTVCLSKPEWDILSKEIHDAEFCVTYEHRDSTLYNDGCLIITMGF